MRGQGRCRMGPSFRADVWTVLEKISTAQPNQDLQITGYTAFGPQRMLVSNVERSEPIVGPTPTTASGQQGGSRHRGGQFFGSCLDVFDSQSRLVIHLF